MTPYYDEMVRKKEQQQGTAYAPAGGSQRFALGGIVPDFGPSGRNVIAGDGTAEAIVPLPNGRSIPVSLANTSMFKDMNDKLDLLARINGAMLESMNKNNSLTRQGLQLAT